MNGRNTNFEKTAFADLKHSFTGAGSKNLLLLIVLCVQFGNICFAQEISTDKVQVKQDTLSPATGIKNTIAADDTSANYSFATYPGGHKAFAMYLIRNIRMPENHAEKLDISIIVTFTIDSTGKLKNFRTSEAPKDFTKEATKLVKASGRWIPANKGGRPIESELQQKISFKTE